MVEDLIDWLALGDCGEDAAGASARGADQSVPLKHASEQMGTQRVREARKEVSLVGRAQPAIDAGCIVGAARTKGLKAKLCADRQGAGPLSIATGAPQGARE